MNETDTNSPGDANSTAIPAATVVIFRHARAGGLPELLMVIRSKAMSFAGGAAVFPGGRVDEADYTLAATLDHGLTDQAEAAHRIAAIRETLEETGLAIGIEQSVSAATARKARAILLEQTELAPVLNHFGWTLNIDKVLPFARWFPKNEQLTRVFDTRFYLYDIGTGAVDIAVDATENTHAFWITAQGALNAAEAGEISIIFPTRRNLERLASFADYAAASADSAAHPVRTITPFLSVEDGVKWLRIGNEHGYPVTGEPLGSGLID